MDFYETSACSNLNIKEVGRGKKGRREGPWRAWGSEGGSGGSGWGSRGGLLTHPSPSAPSPPQSFTRLTELVLQAHRKELEGLRAPPRTPTLARLEETEQQQQPSPSSEENPKSCWC